MWDACDTDDTDSDDSWRDVSPITSDEEYWSDEDEVETSEEVDSDPDVHSSASARGNDSISLSGHNLECECEPVQTTRITLFRLCGDNVDKTIRQRYVRSDSDARSSSSVHYFHSYAVADRIDFSNLSENVPFEPTLDSRDEALLVLPSIEDDKALHENFKILISRILYENMEYFKHTFDGSVTWHIKHCHYDEMSKKSDIQ